MKFMLKILLLASMTFLVACGNSTPKCSDQETQNLVLEIVKEQLEKEAMGFIDVSEVKYKIENIRTTNYNKQVDSYECAADVKFEGLPLSEGGPITYTVESTDDGKSFYVSVSQLWE
jgi:hypothetical protein